MSIWDCLLPKVPPSFGTPRLIHFEGGEHGNNRFAPIDERIARERANSLAYSRARRAAKRGDE